MHMQFINNSFSHTAVTFGYEAEFSNIWLYFSLESFITKYIELFIITELKDTVRSDGVYIYIYIRIIKPYRSNINDPHLTAHLKVA